MSLSTHASSVRSGGGDVDAEAGTSHALRAYLREWGRLGGSGGCGACTVQVDADPHPVLQRFLAVQDVQRGFSAADLPDSR